MKKVIYMDPPFRSNRKRGCFVFAFLVSRFPNDDFLVRESDKLLFKALEGRRKQFSTIEEEQLQKMLDTIQ